MKIIHYICPRACGKTEFAKKLQEEDPSLLLIMRNASTTDLDWLWERLRGENGYTGVIIDEFLPLTYGRKYDPYRMLAEFRRLGCEELTLISTPDRLYNPSILEDYDLLVSRFMVNSGLPYDLTIIQTKFDREYSSNFLEAQKQILPDEQFKCQILGQFIERPKKITEVSFR